MDQTKGLRFRVYQNYYFKITWIMFGIGIILFVLGYLYVQAVTNAPAIMLYAATVILYYHIAHFVYGIGSLIYFLNKLKRSGIKIIKTIFGILTTPISFMVIYGAVFLLSVSQCVA